MDGPLAALLDGMGAMVGAGPSFPRGGLPILGVIFFAPLVALQRNVNRNGSKDKDGSNYRPRPLSATLCELWIVASAVACAAALMGCELDFGGLARLAANEASTREAAAADLDGPAADLDDNATTTSLEGTNDALAAQCFMASLVLGTALMLELMNVVARRGAGKAAIRVDDDDDDDDDTNAISSAIIGSSGSISGNKSSNNNSNSGNNNGASSRRQPQPGICVLYDLPDSECMVLVYLVLFLVYLLTYFDRDGSTFGLMFADPLAARGGSMLTGGIDSISGLGQNMGIYRPVSTIRYIEWIVASPLLMSLVGRALPRKRRTGSSIVDVEDVLRPGLTLTAVYISVAWLALATADLPWRFFLIFVSFVGFALSSYDQLTSWMDNADLSSPRAQTAALLMKIQIGVYFSYGGVYLLGPTCNVLSPLAEQAVVTFADSTIKIACSAFLAAMRYADALADARKERTRAKNIAGDLRQMILTASAPIFSVNRSFRIELWNDKFASLTGLTSEEVLGQRMEDLLSAECREEVFSVLRDRMKGVEGSSQFHCEFDLTKFKQKESDGASNNDRRHVVSVIMSATAKHDSGGLIVGVVGVGQDRTEVTRYKVIEQKQNEFMGVISHELKSPLHGIVGLAENLSQSEQTTSRKEQLKLIRSCATRLIDLVSNIMEMSKLRRMDENGGEGTAGHGGGNHLTTMRQMRKEPVDISSIVSEVCLLVKSSTDKGGRPLLNPLVEMVNNIPSATDAAKGKKGPRLPIVEGDAYKITQVFYNLITNSCKFCSSGHIHISARLLATDEKLEISIEDTGIGIKPEAIKRIFEPFEQESNTSKRSFGGIGLGLAISKEVALLHDGDLRVDSVIGKGSTFTLTLPVTKEAIAISMEPLKEKEDSVSSNSASAAQNTLARRVSDNALDHRPRERPRLEPSFEVDTQRRVILSVDDDIVNQEVIKSTLSNDYEIEIAMNGYDAIEYFNTNSTLPDLVLLDVMMPGLDGFEVLKTIREDMQLSPAELPVIMLSAMEPADQAVIKSLSKGSNDYVSKPFDPDILKARVGIAAEMKRLRQLERDTLYYTRLLHDILPAHIVEKLVDGEGKATGMSEKHDQVCLLFADIVGWTPMSEKVPTHALISLLNKLFSEFDDLTSKHQVFKADTIGDCYIVAAGHEGGSTFDATLRVAQFAMDMLEATKKVKPPRGMKLQLRVGIHTGPAYSGVVGTKVPKYTFFGDTVNTASRMESSGVSNCINISSSAHAELLREVPAHHGGMSVDHWLRSRNASIVKREGVEVKGKGAMDMYLICPPGVSPPLARNLATRRSSRMSRGSLSSSFASMNQSHHPDDQWGSRGSRNLPELAESSQNSSWRDIEILNNQLLQAKAEIGRLSGSGGGDMASANAEELQLKLLVTTRRLAQTRQMLLQKEAELDEKELQLQRALSRGCFPTSASQRPPTVISSHAPSDMDIMSSALERAHRILADSGGMSPPMAPLTSSHENEVNPEEDLSDSGSN